MYRDIGRASHEDLAGLQATAKKLMDDCEQYLGGRSGYGALHPA
jgi:hypothetical protein